MGHIDYSTDVPKHFVRTRAWLPACREQARARTGRSKKAPLKYFTFCAADAIDVFMLERDGILSRSEQSGRLEGVYFCEKDPQAFGIIAGLIGSPEQGFDGEFEKIVLFQDDNDTEGRSLLDEAEAPYPPEVRRKLRYKDAHQRLRQAFPFDIINLDVFGVMFPPRKAVIAPLLLSILQILKWQAQATYPSGSPCRKFSLFLTSHLDPDQADEAAISQLAGRFQANIDSNTRFREAIVSLYGHLEVDKLVTERFPEFFCFGFPKFIIHKGLFDLGLRITYGPSYLYARPDIYTPGKNYHMMHSTAVCERIPGFGQRLDEPGTTEYTECVSQLIEAGIIHIETHMEDVQIREDLANDLANIVQYRDQRN
jgi:hypothetical protein